MFYLANHLRDFDETVSEILKMGRGTYFGLSQFFRNILLVEIRLLLKSIHAFSSFLLRRNCTFGIKVATLNIVVMFAFELFLVKLTTHHTSTITFRKLCALKGNEVLIF
jgi:hypothetical protein